MATMMSPTAQSVVLEGVSWTTYAGLVADCGDNRVVHLAYDQGRLEMIVPSFAPEDLKHLLTLLVEMLAYELGVDLVGAGSTTFKREDMARGFEPDASFYIQHAAAMRGKTAIDLTDDPPPDLVIEIDIPHPSLNKLPIYAALGVSEVWRYEGEQLVIYRREGPHYATVEASTALSGISRTSLVQFLKMGQQLPRAAWFAAIQAWGRTPQE